MVTFDFMHDEALRASLESDYRELEACIKVGAWKAVHVLAGSIIETILIDYLVETDYMSKKSINLKDLKLFQIINICQKEGILSDKATALSHIIREYRNLIHPEKMIRVNEVVDEDGATVAHALVKIVIGEISATRKQTYGYTAEQIVTKIQTDSSVLPVLNHLLKKTNEQELKRLLIKTIPQTYIFLQDPNNRPPDTFVPDATFSLLQKAFRLAFDMISDMNKKAVVEEFARVVKEESAEVISIYELAFFRGTDLKYLPAQEIEVVKDHIISKLSTNHSDTFLESLSGIGKFLTGQEAIIFVGVVIGSFVSTYDELDFFPYKNYLHREYMIMGDEAKEVTIQTVYHWATRYRKRRPDIYKAIKEMKESLSIDGEVDYGYELSDLEEEHSYIENFTESSDLEAIQDE